jgi:very-short-patch-repair endonuclease
MADWQDHYRVLGVDWNATQVEIKDAHRFKVFTQHPDRLRDAPESVKRRAEEELKKLNIAYEILRDPEKRTQYDQEWNRKNQSYTTKPKHEQPTWHSPSEMNELERKFFDAAIMRIPNLIPQFEVQTSSGKKYRLDFAKIINPNSKRNKLLKIAIELDGHNFHKTKEQRTNDIERQHNLELDGWKVIRFTGSQIYKDLNRCVDVAAKLIDKSLEDYNESIIYKTNDAYRPPFINGLRSNLNEPQLSGSTIQWTATATSSNSDPIFYRFWLKGPATGYNWRSMTSWTTNNLWSWKPKASDIGNNTIKVEVRDKNHTDLDEYDDWKVINYEIHSNRLIFVKENIKKFAGSVLFIFILISFVSGLFGSNKQPEISGLIQSVVSPNIVGTIIDWETLASDPEDDQLYYRYFLNGKAQTDWRIDKTWKWDTTGFEPGIYRIEVRVQDGKHAEVDKGDASETQEFTLTTPPQPPNNKPIIDILKSDVPSPQKVGTAIKWTAFATDPESDSIYYRFCIKGPSTNDNWQIVRDWNARKTWIWETSSSDLGDSQIMVQVRDDGKANQENEYDEGIICYTIIEQGSIDERLIDKSPEGNFSDEEPKISGDTPEKRSEEIINKIVSKFNKPSKLTP